jgi:membrane-bound metal-dependent hydrolase YbcI (DUF457 family)
MMGKTHYAFGALFTAAAAPPTADLLGINLSPGKLAIGVAIGMVAGVLPDIDHPSSMITKGLLPGSKQFGFIGRGIGQVLSLPPRIVGLGARATMNHRGGTHSALFMLAWTLLAAPLYALLAGLAACIIAFILAAADPIIFHPLFHHNIGFSPGAVVHWLIHETPSVMPLVMISVFWGYFAHLFSDSMTKVPVPWPWPFSKRRLWILPKNLRVTTDSPVENHFIRPVVVVLAVLLCIINIGIPVIRGVIDHNSHRAQPSPQPSRGRTANSKPTHR